LFLIKKRGFFVLGLIRRDLLAVPKPWRAMAHPDFRQMRASAAKAHRPSD